MLIDIEEADLKKGVMGLVMALVEIIRDALETQALRRVESESLTAEETERLGRALKELGAAIEGIKQDLGIVEAVQSVRDGLDDIADDVVQQLIFPHQKGDDSRGVANGKNQLARWH